jgi:hypothetical protein
MQICVVGAGSIGGYVGAVIELGRLTGTPTPHIEAVHALVKCLARTVREERVLVRAQPIGAPAAARSNDTAAAGTPALMPASEAP